MLMLNILLLLLLLHAVNALYDDSDPSAEHSAAAVRLDKAGEDDDAELAFRAALRYKPNSVAKSLNLAVALMRYGKLSESRKSIEHTFQLARAQNKPLSRIERSLRALKSEWREVHNEEMDPIAAAGSKKEQNDIKMSQRLPHLQLHQLAERKYLDQETADRGKHGLESRVPPGTPVPPKMKVLEAKRGMDTLLDYVGGKEFQSKYWEQWPLLIRVPGAVNNLVSLEYLLSDGPYGYGSEKTRPPHRNVNFLKREFGNKDTIARDKQLGPKDLLDGMRRNYTLQMLGTHYWIPSVANMSYWLSQVTSRPVSVNLYSTPMKQEVSLVPHSDFQCALMVQLEGRKRWRLWKLPDIWLPVRYRHIRGRDDGDIVDKDWLGDPYMDVILEPGDVLYVPRGCLHLTSTADIEMKEESKKNKKNKKNKKSQNVKKTKRWEGTPLPSPSIHLTVGMEAMWDHGVSATWEAFFGAGEFFHHEHAVESYYTAIGNLIDKDIRFRETLPMSFLADDEEFQLTGEGSSPEFVAQVRDRMHTLVDEMVDSTSFIKRVRRLMLMTKSQHNNNLKDVVENAGMMGRKIVGDEL